ncbi:hypothetical protein [Halorubrum sp. DTA98]|uniref:hypothetical protein n=1 Tax=Halorubrum sp. DTA98 TaxID=3402163 RepID=UPI003AB0B623
MVDDRLSDGRRIAQLLASEITGDRGRLRDLRLADADPDVEPTADGALAYTVVRGAGNGETERGAGNDEYDAETVGAAGSEDRTERIAAVYVQPDRVRVEFVVAADVVADVARDSDLRVRPKAVRPPRTIVFVEDGAAVKRVLSAFEAA